MTHPSLKRNMVPKLVLMRSGLVSLTTVRPVNTAQPRTTMNSARPMTIIFNKAHSTVKRPIHKNTAFKNSNFNQRVNTVKDKNVNTAKPKAVLNDVKGNQINVVKDSACWVWKPKTKGNPHQNLQEKGVIDSGCSRGNPKGGKITDREFLVRIRIKRIGENKNRKRVVWNKNRQSDLVRKRIEKSGINLLLLGKVNAARHKLTTAGNG
ncbi:hypothetical protein Tco_1097710 [Tanacetum coccineum]